MTKPIEGESPKGAEAPKLSFEELQKKKLIEVWGFKASREAELKGIEEKGAKLQEEFKALQTKATEVSTQKRDADVVIQTIAQILNELGIDANEVLKAAFTPPSATEEAEAEEITAETIGESVPVDGGNEEQPTTRKR